MRSRLTIQLIALLVLIFQIEPLAGELPSNRLTSTDKYISLDHWQITKDADPSKKITIIPDSLWQKLDANIDENLYSEGNWIIRTKIEVIDSLDKNTPISLFPLNLVTAYEIYWDEIKLGQNGKIGNTKSEEVAGNYEFNLNVSPELLTKGNHTVTLRLSVHQNFSSWKWFYGDIVIGKYELLLKKIFQSYYQAFFITGILFIPFLFNLFLYVSRKRKVEHLLFSLICLIVILDSVTLLIPVLMETRTTLVFWQYYSYQMITLLFTVLFPIFFIYLFSFPKKIIGAIVVITLLIFWFYMDIVNLFNVMTLTVLIISSIITIWALYKRREESGVVFIGIIAAWAAYYFNIAFAGLATTMVICTSFSTARQFAKKETAEKEAQLKSTRLENELLKKNINPHFVLNTLTSIIAWLRKDPPSAIQLIEALAEEFRIINQVSNQKLIPISQEIELCKAHLKIMSYRKGAEYNLETIDLDDNDTVPPMIFHTLVENGLTHGFENKTTGMFKLNTIKNSGSIKYILTNDGDFNINDTKGSTGFGAKYIKGRLEESYPGSWNFTSDKFDAGWKSVIEIRNR